jgi:hypothetical protein
MLISSTSHFILSFASTLPAARALPFVTLPHRRQLPPGGEVAFISAFAAGMHRDNLIIGYLPILKT